MADAKTDSTFEDWVEDKFSCDLKPLIKVRKHLLEAKKQQLLAVKSVIDGATDWLDKEIDRAAERIEKDEKA